MATIECPVCGKTNLPEDLLQCPQCNADLECFRCLDELQEQVPARESADTSRQLGDIRTSLQNLYVLIHNSVQAHRRRLVMGLGVAGIGMGIDPPSVGRGMPCLIGARGRYAGVWMIRSA